MMKNIFLCLRSVLFLFVVFTIMAGCAPTGHVKLEEPEEDPSSYVRIAAILAQLLPEMDVVNRGRYSFAVSDDEELNAFALYQYTIIVNKGLLRALNDRELTCVLAHEIAHISLGHYDRRATVEYSRHLVFGELGRHPDGGLLASTIKPFATRAFSREQETDADIEAVRAIRHIGLSPADYIALLKKLGEDAQKKGEGKGGGLLDDHPSIQSRIEKIEKISFSGEGPAAEGTGSGPPAGN